MVFKSNKGQVYIFVAILMSVFLTGMVLLNFSYNKHNDRNNGIVQNYKNELYYVMNYALYDSKNAVDYMENYTIEFTETFKGRTGSELQVLLLIYDKNSTHIINRCKQNISLKTSWNKINVAQEDSAKIVGRPNFTTTVAGQTYSFEQNNEPYKGIITIKDYSQVYVSRI